MGSPDGYDASNVRFCLAWEVPPWSQIGHSDSGVTPVLCSQGGPFFGAATDSFDHKTGLFLGRATSFTPPPPTVSMEDLLIKPQRNLPVQTSSFVVLVVNFLYTSTDGINERPLI